MSDCSFVDLTCISPNCNRPRKYAVSKITPHHMAGNLTLEQIAAMEAKPSRQMSSNYAISSDGGIALLCHEADRSWCSSSPANDHRAITVEVANDQIGGQWHVSDAALEALVKLCVDICQRNGIPKLLWKGDKNLVGQVDRQNMTVHRWFAAKACPGDWLYSRHGQIAAEVNKRLEAAKAGKDEEAMDTKQLTSCADTGDNPSAWAKEATDYCKRKGIFAGDGAGNYGWQKPITREATAQIIYNLLEAAGMLEKLPDVK